MTAPPDPVDPVLRLLEDLVRRDEERKGSLEDLLEQSGKIMRLLEDEKAARLRMEVSLREIKGELGRQDAQIRALEERVAGNYNGLAAQYDVIVDELTKASERIGNMERATVEISKSSRVLHGHMIEATSAGRERDKKFEGELDVLKERLKSVEGENSKGARVGI